MEQRFETNIPDKRPTPEEELIQREAEQEARAGILAALTAERSRGPSPEQLLDILEHRFFGKHTQEETANALGVHRNRVDTWENLALRLLVEQAPDNHYAANLAQAIRDIAFDRTEQQREGKRPVDFSEARTLLADI